MMNVHDDKIGLWQLLYICKAEKTHLKFMIRLYLRVYVFNELLQTNYKR